MATTNVELSTLSPPPTRAYAEPDKLKRMGAFDWTKYTPIIVEKDGTRLIIQDGMTRVEAALRVGITSLPAYVYPKRD